MLPLEHVAKLERRSSHVWTYMALGGVIDSLCTIAAVFAVRAAMAGMSYGFPSGSGGL